MEKDGGKQFPKLHNGSLSGSLINLRKRRNQTNRNRLDDVHKSVNEERKKSNKNERMIDIFRETEKRSFPPFTQKSANVITKECYTVKSATWYQSVDYS